MRYNRSISDTVTLLQNQAWLPPAYRPVCRFAKPSSYQQLTADIMPSQNAIFTVLLFVTTGALGAFALYARLRRSVAGAPAFVWLALAVAEWVLTYALELGTPSEARKILYAELQYLGIASVPLAWLAFTLQYTGKGAWLTRRRLALLLIEPLITLLLVFTNTIHRLIWSSIGAAGEFMPLPVEHGPWFWIHVAFSYMLMLLG